VRLYHLNPWISFGDPSSTTATKRRRKSGIINKAQYLLDKILGISHAERKTRISQDFGERPEIRCNNRETARHVFGKNQTEDLPSERGHHNYAGFCKR
jgi:hypothetical protein